MNLIIGSDHAGFGLKEECRLLLENDKEHNLTDAGVFDRQSSNYPDIAHKVSQAVISGEYDRGILICGSGVGMSITANRYKGIRAALCHNTYLARMCRMHNNANILVMGDRVIGVGLALEMLKVFIETEFEGGRHQTRLDMIDC